MKLETVETMFNLIESKFFTNGSNLYDTGLEWNPKAYNKNKGFIGHWLEKQLDIPHGPEHLDLIDGDLKTWDVKANKKGELTGKEDFRIMKNETDSDDIVKKMLWEKMGRMLVVPVLRPNFSEGLIEKTVHILKPKILDLQTHPLSKDLETLLLEDFEIIIKKRKESNISQGDTSALIYKTQASKGSRNAKGNLDGNTSRSFYFSSKFMSWYFGSPTQWKGVRKANLKKKLEEFEKKRPMGSINSFAIILSGTPPNKEKQTTIENY